MLFAIISAASFIVFSPEDCKTSLQIFYIISCIIPIWILRLNKVTSFNLVSLFLFMLFFFGGLEILLDFVGYLDMNELDFFYSGKVKTEISNRTIYNYILTNVAIAIGCTVYYYRFHSFNGLESSRELKIPNAVIYLLLIIGFVSQAYTSYLEFSFISLFSYHEAFISGVSIPLYVRALNTLPIYLCLYKIMKGRRIWFMPLLLYCGMIMTTGQRGPALLILMTAYYFAYKKKVVKVNIFKLILAGVVIAILSNAMSNIRNKKETLTEEDTLIGFFAGQCGSISVLQITMEMEKKLDYHFKDLFGNVYSAYRFLPLTDVQPSSDNLTSTGKQYKVWSKYISYETNPEMYYRGLGLGGNYIAQMWIIGGEVLVLISGFVVGFVLIGIDGLLGQRKNPFFIFLLFSFLRVFMYIPRDNFFSFLTGMNADIIAIFVVYIMTRLVQILKQDRIVKVYNQ